MAFSILASEFEENVNKIDNELKYWLIIIVIIIIVLADGVQGTN